MFRPERRPGPELHRAAAARSGLEPFARRSRRPPADRPSRSVTARPSRPSATPTAWSWPVTGGPPPARRSPTGPWRRCTRPTATAGSPSPARPGRPWRWCSCSSSSSSTTRRSRARPVSLEGKANQLSQMVRSNLAMAMQGFVVVPLFAGYDLRRRRGPDLHLRPDRRPLRGDRLPRRRLRRPRRPHHHQARLADRTCPAPTPSSWPSRPCGEAADEDSATGGPDAVRGIYPTVATITARRLRAGAGGAEVAERFAAVVASRTSRGQQP